MIAILRTIVYLFVMVLVFFYGKYGSTDYELWHAKDVYIEIFEKDAENNYSVVMNWTVFYNHQSDAIPEKMPTEEGLCQNMCREIKGQ